MRGEQKELAQRREGEEQQEQERFVLKRRSTRGVVEEQDQPKERVATRRRSTRKEVMLLYFYGQTRTFLNNPVSAIFPTLMFSPSLCHSYSGNPLHGLLGLLLVLDS